MSLLAAFSSSILKSSSTTIDNVIFQLHYRITAIFLAASALLVTSSQYFGTPITCGPPPPSLSTDLLENYCWTRSTYSLSEYQNNGGPHPGVDTSSSNGTVYYHTYYQWVWLVLSLQSAMFYVPRLLWKSIEGGKIKILSSGLQEPIGNVTERTEKRNMVVRYITDTWDQRKMWGFSYFFCELLNLINVIGQIYLIDEFLGGSFANFGVNVVKNGLFVEQEDRTDAMLVVFPRVTKCEFRAFGPSGNVQIHDSICVLSLNIINEKIYVILWFWLMILAVPSAIMIVYRLGLICIPRFRVFVMCYCNSNVKYEYVERVVKKAPIGDWLFLDLLAKNLNPQVFEKLMADLITDEIDKLKEICNIKANFV